MRETGDDMNPVIRPSWSGQQPECERFYEGGKKVKPLNLDRLGYRLTARYVIAGGNYKIFELLPINSAHAAEVSFLTPDIRFDGVIIANPFHEHKAKLNFPAQGGRAKKARLAGNVVFQLEQ